jgi:hypothetical protein
MNEGHPTDDEWEALTAALISRRVLNFDGVLVRRLLMEADGRILTLLVAPNADTLPDLGVGEQAHFNGVLRCTLWMTSAEEVACYHCGDQLNQRAPLDTVAPAIRDAAKELGLGGTFGVITSETCVSLIEDD